MNNEYYYEVLISENNLQKYIDYANTLGNSDDIYKRLLYQFGGKGALDF